MLIFLPDNVTWAPSSGNARASPYLIVQGVVGNSVRPRSAAIVWNDNIGLSADLGSGMNVTGGLRAIGDDTDAGTTGNNAGGGTTGDGAGGGTTGDGAGGGTTGYNAGGGTTGDDAGASAGPF